MVGKSEKVIRFYQWYDAGYVHILLDRQEGSAKPSEETIWKKFDSLLQTFLSLQNGTK